MLQSTISKLCRQAGFDGFFTNHSLRATAATRLYNAGVDEQLIAEKTGHRSDAIRTYKRTSDEQNKMVDNIVQHKKPKIADKESISPQKEQDKAVVGEKEILINTKGFYMHIKY